MVSGILPFSFFKAVRAVNAKLSGRKQNIKDMNKQSRPEDLERDTGLADRRKEKTGFKCDPSR